MRLRREVWHWPSLLWWLGVLVAVVQIKHHYSIATAAELEWMLRPLARLLEWFTGHEFHKDVQGEWVSETADVRLVKACAGVNFMLMSFMAYAWRARPDRGGGADRLWSIAARPLLLCGLIVASWATGLMANSLRIIAAMTVESRGWESGALGVTGAELHRMIGLVIFVPLLSLQMMLGERGNRREALAVPLLLYLLLLVVVPLATGNALERPAVFGRHLLSMAVVMTALGGIYFLCHHRFGGKRRIAPGPGQ
jgi:exosortase K